MSNVRGTVLIISPLSSVSNPPLIFLKLLALKPTQKTPAAYILPEL